MGWRKVDNSLSPTWWWPLLSGRLQDPYYLCVSSPVETQTETICGIFPGKWILCDVQRCLLPCLEISSMISIIVFLLWNAKLNFNMKDHSVLAKLVQIVLFPFHFGFWDAHSLIVCPRHMHGTLQVSWLPLPILLWSFFFCLLPALTFLPSLSVQFLDIVVL